MEKRWRQALTVTQLGAAERVGRLQLALQCPGAAAECVLLVLGIDSRFHSER
jgi:hypothetical protein